LTALIREILLFGTGIILLLFGMVNLSAAVRQQFNNVRIREYFKFAVNKRVYGLATGIVSTILVQSSTATSILVVGMVSAGLMSFYRSLPILLGADIGTAFTVQLVVWRVTDLSPIFIIAGGVLWFSGKARWKALGEALFYFGLIFFGLSLVSMASEPLKENAAFLRFFQETKNPFLSIIAGVLFASVIHSSAVPISILVILAQHQLITLESALPIVFGANIGTAVTALAASLIANINGKRSAVSHFLFKFFGTVVCFALFPFFTRIVTFLSSDPAQQIAFSHLLFNGVIVGFFIFLLKPFSRLVEFLLPGKAETLPLWPEFLDDRLLPRPEEALECVRKELTRELILVKNMFEGSFGLIRDFREGKRRDIGYIELIVDNLRKEVARYLWKISSGDLSPDLYKKLFAFSGMVDDIERMGDHSVDLMKLCRVKHQRNMEFTGSGYSEIDAIGKLVIENIDDAVLLLENGDSGGVKRIFEREDRVDLLVKESRNRHLERFHRRICQAEAGPIFIEMLINIERISDHCENIAEYIQELKT
jgi:phosphate:Na+ symporter